MSSKIRLIKIASEINVSKDTIVEFLLTRGFSIDNKPTATLDQDMQDIVYEKFQKEKEKAEIQRKKLLKQKESAEEVSKTAEETQETPKTESVKVTEEKAKTTEPEEKTVSAEVVETKKTKTTSKKTEEPKEEEVQNVAPEEPTEKVVTQRLEDTPIGTKIDLDKSDESKAKTKTTKKKTTKTEEKAKTTKSTKKRSSKDDKTRHKKYTENLTTKLGDLLKGADIVVPDKSDIADLPNRIQAKIEAEKQEKQEKKAKRKSTKKKDEIVEEEKIEIVEEVKEEVVVEEESKEIDEEPTTEEVVEEIEEEDDDDKRELKGLTVLGKIELKRDPLPSGYYKDKHKRKNKNSKDKKKSDNKSKAADKKGKADKGEKTDKKFISREAKRTKVDNNQGTTSTYKDKGKASKKPRVFNDEPAKPAKLKNAMYAEKKKKRSIRETLTEEDVNRKIRETLSGMDDHSSNIKKSRIKQKKKIEKEEKEARLQEISEIEAKSLNLTEFVTTSDLSKLINVPVNEIIMKCMQLGLMVTINQRLDKDTILLIASDYGLEVEFEEEEKIPEIEDVEDEPSDLLPRPPIVTIMGHVDHGKTSLLDHIRSENVVAGEAGGITQHIGAYRVILKNGKSITFLDTPGHEAFTAMRARGAQVTDLVVLVVSADDNVMPQTIEAISHARAANVPMVVAINKIDKPDASPDRIKQQLSEQGVLVEEWGGKIQCAEISAKKGLNVDTLLDKILLEAELLELKANPNRNATGIVIESKMTKGWGNVATVVVQKGTLEPGDAFVAGTSYGKTRALLDERGNKVLDVLPSQPVVVIGFDGLPEAGDTFNVVKNESQARDIATSRRQLRREQEMRKVRHTTLDDISAQIAIGGVKELFLVIKGDVAGSVEALSDSLQKLSTEEVRVNILHKSAGNITESDVMLATASNAVIIGFNTITMPQASKLADIENVEIRNYNIIYDCINEIQLALEGLLKPDVKEEILATIEVRKIFKIGRIGQIAGCYVLSGKVSRNDKIRILRDGLPIHTAVLSSLKRNKDDVKEVDQNYECGIQIEGWNSFQENDIIEAYKLVEVRRTLSS